MIEFAIRETIEQGDKIYRVVGRRVMLLGLLRGGWRSNSYGQKSSLDENPFLTNWKRSPSGGTVFTSYPNALAFYQEAVLRYGGRVQKKQIGKNGTLGLRIFNPYDETPQ